MKKEVSAIWISIILIAILCLSVVVFADDDVFDPPAPPTDPSEDLGFLEDQSLPKTDDPVEGYWIAYIGISPTEGAWYPICDDCGLDTAEYTDTGFPLGIPPNKFIEDDSGSPILASTLKLKTLYKNGAAAGVDYGFKESLDSFISPIVPEIYQLKFVLAPIPFKNSGYTEIMGSHAGYGADLADLINKYENDYIKDCSAFPLDRVDECIADHKLNYLTDVVHRSGFELDLLKHEDCSEFADLNPQFCQGVPGANELSMEVNRIGVPGTGGCYYPDPGPGNHPARDWFYNIDAREDFRIPLENIDTAPYWSDQFMPGYPDADQRKADIWRCCGNDPDDFGAIFGKDDELDYKHRFMCANASIGIEGDEAGMLQFDKGSAWLAANDPSVMFRIVGVQRPLLDDTISFDAVSNYANWFVCDSQRKMIDAGLYGESITDDADGSWLLDSGPALDEYYGLPPLEEGLDFGTTRGETPVDDDESGFDYSDSIGPDDQRSAGDLIDHTSIEDGLDEPIGVEMITDCDKDGDGYDGYWSEDPTAGEAPTGSDSDWTDNPGPWVDPDLNLDCIPRAPFDCHDNDRTISPAAIDYCDGVEQSSNTVDNDCNVDRPCVPDIPGQTIDELRGTADMRAEIFIPRFICHDIDGYGAFAECCGGDLRNCENGEKARREGSAVNTLNEFTTHSFVYPVDSTEGVVDTTNMVLRYGISGTPTDYTYDEDSEDDTYIAPDDTYRLNLHYAGFDDEIRDWSRYRTLEFDVYFMANFELEMWVGFLNPALEGDPDYGGSVRHYEFPFKARVLDYVVGEPKLRQWMHVIIPVDDIYGGAEFDVGNIVFASNIRRLINLGTSVHGTIGGETDYYSNVVGIDKIALRPYDSDEIMPGASTMMAEDDENYYCSGTWPPVWVSDLDDASLVNDEPKGRAACNSIPSYHWTGNYCCGDDNGANVGVDEGIIGQYADKEFFADDPGACWAGRYMVNGERVMLVQFDMQYVIRTEDPLFDKTLSVSCSNHSCTYGLPQREGVLIENPWPDEYDLTLLNGGVHRVGNGAVVTDENSFLRAENVPLKILYNDTEFYTCNAEEDDYIFDEDILFDTNQYDATGSKVPLLTWDPDHNYGNCQIAGGYFCSHEDGKNLGWDSEALKLYPDPNPDAPKDDAGNPLYNLIDEEGEDIPFGSSTIVRPDFRIKPKTGYNLITNGGFENV